MYLFMYLLNIKSKALAQESSKRKLKIMWNSLENNYVQGSLL